MAYYLSLLFFILFTALVSKKSRHHNPSWITIIMLFCPLWIIHAFANPLSMGDTPEYCDIYLGMKDISFMDIFTRDLPYDYARIEPGWLLFSKALTGLFSNPQALIICDSTLILAGYAFIIKKYSPTPWLSALIFLCTLYPQSLFVLRQHTALAILLFSIPYVLERRFKPFIFLVVISTSIHVSAILFSIVYFVYSYEINAKFYWRLILSTALMYFAGMFLLNALVSYRVLNDYFTVYFGNVNNYSTLIICVLEFVFVYIFVKLGKNLCGIHKLVFMLLLLMLSLSVIALTTPLGGRLSIYFAFGEILIFPLCAALDKKHKYLINIITAFVFIAFALVRMDSTWLDINLINMSLIF